jgi:Ni/Fe-hydrogenase subunit HybB-like protein
MVGAMGYTLAGASVLVDLGRWWNLWILFWPPIFNWNSGLLEVSLCVLSYCIVLWIETVPPVLEYLEAETTGKLQRIGRTYLPVMKKALPFIISLALLLPTMHQSSLGGLYMITVTKLHQLWQTGWISFLFLVSCFTMGFGSVIVIENLTDMIYDRKMDQKLLSSMWLYPVSLIAIFMVTRFADLAHNGRLGLIFKFDMYSIVFLVENGLYIAAAYILLNKKLREQRAKLFLAGVILIFQGAMYRLDTYLVAFQPVGNWVYSPSVGEVLFSLTLLSIGILVYIVMIKMFPLLSGVYSRKKLDTNWRYEPNR